MTIHKNKTVPTFTTRLPELMTAADYDAAHRKKTVRLRLKVTDEGLEIIGDTPYPQLLDQLLTGLEPETIERVLCG